MLLARCDGGKQLGLGHVRRSLTLARQFKSDTGSEVHVVFREDPASRAAVETSGLGFTVLPASMSEADEVPCVLELMQRLQPRFVWMDVLDRAVRADLMAPLMNRGSVVCAISDENEEVDILADVAFLTSPGHHGRKRERRQGTLYCHGMEYFVLSPTYREAPIPEELRPRQLLVSLGGTDQNDLLSTVAHVVIEALPADWTVEVIVGSGYSGLAETKRALEAAGLESQWAEDVDDLPTRLRNCRLALTAAGNTLFERMAAGVAGIAVAQSDREAEHARLLADLGATALGFRTGGLDREALGTALRRLTTDTAGRRRMEARARELLDGGGLERVLSVMQAVAQERGNRI